LKVTQDSANRVKDILTLHEEVNPATQKRALVRMHCGIPKDTCWAEATLGSGKI